MGARHLLVTNDFPPKLGGIQSYLWELWRRLPAEDVCVVTPDHEGAAEWDAQQAFRVERLHRRWMAPTPRLVRAVNELAREHRADLVVIDPVGPLGLAAGSIPGVRYDLPAVAVLHGAEVTIPARHPLFRWGMRACLRNVDAVISAGRYPLAEAERCAGPLRSVLVPPGVDHRRFAPLDEASRTGARARFGFPDAALVVLGLSRLVPRKGFDVLIDAAARCRQSHPELVLAIAGTGRDEDRLRRRASRAGFDVRFLGRLDDAELPALYGAADVFAMLCRDRWFGWEQEGFGIVFLEAAACGVPQIAGRSGGSWEAVAHGESGLVVDPTDVVEVAGALGGLLADPARRATMGHAARARAVGEFDLDALAAELRRTLEAWARPGAAGQQQVSA